MSQEKRGGTQRRPDGFRRRHRGAVPNAAIYSGEEASLARGDSQGGLCLRVPWPGPLGPPRWPRQLPAVGPPRWASSCQVQVKDIDLPGDLQRAGPCGTDNRPLPTPRSPHPRLLPERHPLGRQVCHLGPAPPSPPGCMMVHPDPPRWKRRALYRNSLTCGAPSRTDPPSPPRPTAPVPLALCAQGNWTA